MRGAKSLRPWILLCFACASAGWALLLPLGTSADEPAHVMFAAAVARGGAVQAPPGLNVVIPARMTDVALKDCTHRRPAQTSVCAPTLSQASGNVYVPTEAAGYPKLYYLAVGAPTLGTFTETSWYLMRLLSVLLGTILLAIGLWNVRPQRLPAAAVAVLLACSPAVAAIVSAVNPSGPEIMAGLAAALAASGLVDALHVGDSRRARRAAVSIAVMITYLTVARPATWAVALGVLTIVVLFAAQPLLELGRRKPLLLASGFAAVFVAMALAQVLWGVIPRPLPPGNTMSWGKALFRSTLPNIWERLVESVVRVADTDLASWATSSLLITLLVVLGTALWLGSWWQRLAMLAGAFGAVIAGPVFAFHSVFINGDGYQARYAAALFSATVALSVGTIAERRLSWTSGRWASMIPEGWALLMLATQVSVFARYAHGIPSPSLTLQVLMNHEWLPPAWPVVILLLAGMILAAERVSSAVFRPVNQVTETYAPRSGRHSRHNARRVRLFNRLDGSADRQDPRELSPAEWCTTW